jgi:RNA polymerase sigma factor (sigma-70 family)
MLQHDATPMLEIQGNRLGVVPTRGDRDSSLVAALRRGGTTAADSLVAAYGDRAFRLALRITGSAEDAEEVVQDALWSVIRKIETFRGDSAFGSWLYRVVANAAYQRLRKRRGQSAEISLDTAAAVHQARSSRSCCRARGLRPRAPAERHPLA